MRYKHFLLLLNVSIALTGCDYFIPKPVSIGHIPPALTQPRIVHGCSKIQNELKLATCYLKTSEALYLANQDKQSLSHLERQWSN